MVLIKPCRSWKCGTGIYVDDVSWIEWGCRTITFQNFHVCVSRQVGLGRFSQFRINLDPCNTASRTYHFRHDGSVITVPCSHMDNMLPIAGHSLIQQVGMQGWLAVIDFTLWYDANEIIRV